MAELVPSEWSRRIAKLTAIVEVARALAAERRLEPVFERIVEEAARVVEAERCTLFVADREKGELWSKVALGAEEIRVPLSAGLAGTVVALGRPLRIDDAYADPRFNPEVDRSTGYRTRSVLAVPMWNTRGEIVGVLEALNRRDGPFTAEDEQLLGALAGPAASALENAILNEEIERLFEGFVRASVLAIEQRDPTTAGHSSRVAALCVGLARAAEKDPPPSLAGLRFDPADLQQLRYAALLHDFGKVGVREHVLTKADKLYPHELALLRARFDRSRLLWENEALRAQLAGRDEVAAALFSRTLELEGTWGVVLAANRPTVLAADASARLEEAANTRVPGPQGEEPLLSPEELAALSIPRGSLSEAERREIESHVTHTFRFLAQIPWTRGLRRVPEIAYAHHEKLDGHGYPRGLPADGIPIEARMMAIADVYDALTSSDRPYKKAVPPERALEILEGDARRGQLDAGLLGVFVKAEVYRGEARR
ncbi:MAG TPA: HD domain-containing phosphohydrolase [Anaeromyxobacter sp.]|nr:HD domain-containing phosphohydrolase [Anaeromyxobacter sp.]